jgi:hypothetical protein
MTALSVFNPGSSASESPTVEKLAGRINEQHRQYEDKINEALLHARDAGLLLLQVKESLPHGELRRFMQTHLDFSERMAQDYMKLAKNWETIEGKAQRVAHLSLCEALKLVREPAGNAVPEKGLIARSPFLELLASVSPGIEPKAIVEQSDCFLFEDGHIHAGWDDIYCSAPCDLPVFGAVKAKLLSSVLRVLGFKTVCFNCLSDRIVFHRPGYKAEIQLEENILLSTLPPDEMGEWKELPVAFESAVEAVVPYASKNEAWPVLVHVHIHPDFIEATDRYQIGRFHLKTGVEEPLLVRADNLRHIVDRNFTHFSISETHDGHPKWLNFKNDDDLIYRLRISDEPYVQIEGFLDDSDSLPVTFDDDIRKAVKRVLPASVDEYGRSQLRINLKSNCAILSGHGDKVSIRQRCGCQFDGEPCEFVVRLGLFQNLIAISRECRLVKRWKGERAMRGQWMIAKQDDFVYSMVVND